MGWAAEGTVDRRESSQARIATCRPVTIVSERQKGVVVADTMDLGPGGMFVALADPLPVGERFIFRIDLGEAYKPVLSGGEVRWIDRAEGHQGMGVRFLDIAEVADALGGGEIPTRGPETVRVRMEHVGPAIEARVVERSGSSLVVDLTLPFLRPGAPLEVGPDVAARSGRVQATEWRGAADGAADLRIVVSLDPSAAQAAAGRVAADSAMEASTAPQAEPEEERESVEIAVAPAAHPSEAEALPAPTEAEEPAVPEEASPPPRPALDGGTGVRAVEDLGDEDDSACDSLLRALEERLAAAGILPRLAAAWALALGLWRRIAGSPAVRSVLERVRDRLDLSRLREALGSRGQSLAGRLGPAAAATLAKVRGVRLFRKARKQARGEPSKVVQALAQRGRRSTAGRGRTNAAVLLVALGAAGLATTALGLRTASEVERTRAALRLEAAAQGWSADRWEEPDETSETSG